MQPKIKLAAIAKNEAAYIPQWVFHHLRAGFDCLEFWINGTTDNSLALLERLSRRFPGMISVRMADDLLQECKIREVNFQIEAYSKVYGETKASGDFTHLMFLDLDEYWISLDNKSVKDFISDGPDFDSASFQWFIDIPDYQRNPFDPIFKTETILQKDRHVKSMLKLSDKPTKVLIHNSKISDGVFYLASGVPFEEIDPEQEHRQKVSKQLFDETKKQLDRFFILHLVYKSQLEYLASLTRGRVHVNDVNVFKVNRFGYSPYVNEDQLTLRLDNVQVEDINQSYQRFVEDNDLSELIIDARRFVYARCNQALTIIAENPQVKDTYNQQLRGLQLDVLERTKKISDDPLYHVDVIKLLGDEILVKGWVWDPLSFEKIKITVETKPYYITRVEHEDRPDVLKAHPDANLDCGFSVLIKIPSEELSKVADGELPFKIYVQNSYFRKELRTAKRIVIGHS